MAEQIKISNVITPEGASILFGTGDVTISGNNVTPETPKYETYNIVITNENDLPIPARQIIHESQKQTVENYLTGLDTDKMEKVNPTGSGSVSINRKASTAIGIDSVAMGSETTASGDYSVALGTSTTSSGYGAFAAGQNTKATHHYAVALGNSTEASGQYSFATGAGSEATQTAASALGYSNTASGKYSFATGASSTASGEGAQAMGYSAKAAGKYSLAVGDYAATTSTAQGSLAEGYYTTAASDYQHVQGKYNVQDSAGVYAHIVGNGTKSVLDSLSKQSNAHTLDWDGNAWYSGDVYVGSTSGTNKDEGSVKLVKETDTIPIIHGGTGAITAEDARTNLGAMPNVVVTTSDVGKFLRVNSNGVWAAETILNAEDVSF